MMFFEIVINPLAICVWLFVLHVVAETTIQPEEPEIIEPLDTVATHRTILSIGRNHAQATAIHLFEKQKSVEPSYDENGAKNALLDETGYDTSIAGERYGMFAGETSSKKSSILKTLDLLHHRTNIIWQIHVHLTCSGNCNHKYTKLNKWTKELIQSKEFANSKFRYRTQKLSATHCGCKSRDGAAVELYLNNTEVKRKSLKPCFCYEGDIDNKIEFWNFIRRHHQLPLEFPSAAKFENLLDTPTTTLVIFYSRRCETNQYMEMMKKLGSLANITVYKQRSPLILDIKIELEKRVDEQPDDCQLLLINNGTFKWLPLNTDFTTVTELLQQTNPNDNVQWRKIKEKLTDVEKTFYIGQAMSEGHIWKPACILVGTTGGVAVIALAISIFWGLNGSSFAAK